MRIPQFEATSEAEGYQTLKSSYFTRLQSEIDAM